MKRKLYIARGSLHNAGEFFETKPEMILTKFGNMVWNNADSISTICFVDKIFPNLAMQPGKCMLIEVENLDDDTIIIKVIDRDVKTRIIFA